MSERGDLVSLVMPREMAEFVVKNCEVNITAGLSLLQRTGRSRESAEKLVENIEKFKGLRKIGVEALK